MNYSLQSRVSSSSSSAHFMMLCIMLLLLGFSSIAHAQTSVYQVEYEAQDLTCSKAPVRYSIVPVGCLSIPNGLGIRPGYKFMDVQCLGSVNGSRTITQRMHNSRFCNSTGTPFLAENVLEGVCVARSRYYCSSPPPESIVPTNPSQMVTYRQYDGANSCNIPYWYSPYIHLKLDCYRLPLYSLYSRITCKASSGSGIISVTTWLSEDATNPPTTCNKPIVKSTDIPMYECREDPSSSGSLSIQIESCRISGANTINNNILGWVSLILFVVVCNALANIYISRD